MRPVLTGQRRCPRSSSLILHGLAGRVCSSPAELARVRNPSPAFRWTTGYRWVNSVGSSRVQRWTGERECQEHPLGDPRGPADPAARHRSRRDHRLDRLLRQPRLGARPRTRPLRHAAAARACPRDAGRRPRPAQHRLHQLDPARARAVVPRRRGHRAPDPRLHPLERRRDGLQRQPQGPRGRRTHRDLPVRREPLRGRLQPLLPRQGRPRRRRPDLHPGTRLPRHLRPRLPRGPAHRGAALPVPPGGPARPRQPGCRRTPTPG